MKAISTISLLVLTTISLQANSSLENALKAFGNSEFQKSMKEFITMDNQEQKKLYKLCKNASKKAWGIGAKISEAEYKKNKIVKSKVEASTLKTIEFYNHGYSIDESAQLAKQLVEMTAYELTQ